MKRSIYTKKETVSRVKGNIFPHPWDPKTDLYYQLDRSLISGISQSHQN